VTAAVAVSAWPRRRDALPGFGLTLGTTLAYLGLIVLIPLAGLVAKAATAAPGDLLATLGDPRTLSAFEVSFGIALAAAAVNGAIGLLLAWVLVREDFPGWRLVDALVDLPFALPTAVAGITLATLYSDVGWLGAPLERLGLQVSFTRLGIFVALVFIGLPFVVRTLQPVVAELDAEAEAAARVMGASRAQIFLRVVLPQLLPGLLAGTALAFARGVGEYGSVIFIAGNMPGVSEIVPLLIVMKLEQFDYAGASVVATAMLVLSFLILLAINLLDAGLRRRHGG
jgi:sulfate transport system permease protein